MSDTLLAAELLKAAVGGVSKAQITRTFQSCYGHTEDDIKRIIELCNFKTKPKYIDYQSFYDLAVTKKAQRIYYPFTQVYKQENFLTKRECCDLIEIINANLRPSTVSDPKDECITSDYRTSKTSDLHYFDNSFFLDIDKKISKFMGVEPFLGETMQAQKYEIGQYYKEHWDFFMPTTKEYKVYCDWMGQRTWTSMIYLNDVEAGGETYFKHLNLKVKPQQGTLITWNNLYKNGMPNLKTMHEACSPISGPKYVITKWWRSWSLI